MKEALRARLLADAELAGLVEQRISWGSRPRMDCLPAVCLHLISGVRQYHLGGASDLVQSRVQADCWAPTYAAATAVSRAVVADLSGLRDDTMRVQGAFVVDERDLADEGTAADEILFRVSVDVMIWHEGI